MEKKKLVIASVLKPVSDSRNYEKTAISISKSGEYRIFIVGQSVNQLPATKVIEFAPLFSFSRLSLKRLFAGWTFLNYLLKLKPDVIIVTTFELLLPSVFYKLFFRKKLYYDVQENYFRNLIYTNSFPKPLNYLLAVKVRALEYLTRPFVNFYVLAERNYEKEFSFTKGKSVVIENKLLKSDVVPRVKRNDGKIQLLYTGTIAENYGIVEAVKLAKLLYEKDNRFTLHIIGFAPKTEVYRNLTKAIEGHSYITLTGGDTLVPHSEILKAISMADIGLVMYLPNKSTENCIPTKLYEYAAHRLPYLHTPNLIWKNFTVYYQAGFEWRGNDIESILKLADTSLFYTVPMGEELFLSEEEWGRVLR